MPARDERCGLNYFRSDYRNKTGRALGLAPFPISFLSFQERVTRRMSRRAPGLEPTAERIMWRISRRTLAPSAPLTIDSTARLFDFQASHAARASSTRERGTYALRSRPLSSRQKR